MLLTLSSQFDHFLNLNLNHFCLTVQFIFPTQHLYTRLAASMLRALLYQMFYCRMTEGDWFSSSPLCIPVVLHTHTNLCCLCPYVFSQTWALHLKPSFKTVTFIFFFFTPLEHRSVTTEILTLLEISSLHLIVL